MRSYSSGMQARLAFGMSMGIAFDWYLVDEITAVGDSAFKAKCLTVFRTRLQGAGMLSRRDPLLLRQRPRSRTGEATFFEDVEEAIATMRATWRASDTGFV